MTDGRAVLKSRRTFEIMMEKGLTWRMLADKAGVSTITTTRAREGRGMLPSTVKKIADALGVSPLEIAEIK